MKHFFLLLCQEWSLFFFCFVVVVLMPFYGHLLRGFGLLFNLLMWYVKIPLCSLNNFTWTWTIVILIRIWSETASILFGILIGLFIACHFPFCSTSVRLGAQNCAGFVWALGRFPVTPSSLVQPDRMLSGPELKRAKAPELQAWPLWGIILHNLLIPPEIVYVSA